MKVDGNMVEEPEPENKVYKVTVKMKEPWIDEEPWFKKPTKEDVLQLFFGRLEDGELDDLFEVTVEEVKIKGKSS
jgi:hypothetical protein